MKPTIKVSIGGVAFNLDEDAYHILDKYLTSLRTHFAKNEESSEIISDIEFRLSELLQIRVKNSGTVISIKDAEEVIGIMGNPRDFESQEAENNNTNKSYVEESYNGGNKGFQQIRKKRLYRDMDQRIIAGVCSGIGHYFRIDPVVIRLIFLLPFLISIPFIEELIPGPIIIYLILWLVIPKARTFSDRVAMKGDSSSIYNIEDRSTGEQRGYRGTVIGEVIGIFGKTILIIIGSILALVLIVTVVALIWAYLDTDLSYPTNFLSLVGCNTLNVKAALLLLITLPLVALICLIFKILRRTPFRSQNGVLLSIGVVLWLVATIYLGSHGARFFNTHKYKKDITELRQAETQSDVIYVELDDEYEQATPQPNVHNMVYRDNKVKVREISLLPQINIERIRNDSSFTNFTIEIRKTGRGGLNTRALQHVQNMKLEYILQDSLIKIQPEWYSEKKPWNGEFYNITIRIPENKRVKVRGLLSESSWDFD